MYGYIYLTINLINRTVYVGQKKGKFNPKYFGIGIDLPIQELQDKQKK